MLDSQAKLMHSKIWDLLHDYADIRDELEDVLCGIRSIYEEIETSLSNIGDELDSIEKHLSSTNHSLVRYKASDHISTIKPDHSESTKEEPDIWN